MKNIKKRSSDLPWKSEDLDQVIDRMDSMAHGMSIIFRVLDDCYEEKYDSINVIVSLNKIFDHILAPISKKKDIDTSVK